MEVEDALDKNLSNPIPGVTHFYSTSIAAPEWIKGASFAGQQGKTRFYSNVR
jgi:spore germination cell wall hydrolase CwlJ-like protein